MHALDIFAHTCYNKKGANMEETISNTEYDNVFKTLLNYFPHLVIPLINEFFNTSYSLDDTVHLGNNELFSLEPDHKSRSLITDSSIHLNDDYHHRFHIECQSTPDNSMIVRMFDYDSQIALNTASSVVDNTLVVTFPNSGIHQKLDELQRKEEINESLANLLRELINRVAEKIAAKSTDVKEGVKNIMGGKIIATESTNIFNSGMTQGIREGISQGISQGINQRSIEIATDMFKNNETFDRIERYSKLTSAELFAIGLNGNYISKDSDGHYVYNGKFLNSI